MCGRVITVHIMVVIICWYMSLDNTAFFFHIWPFRCCLFFVVVFVVCLFGCFLLLGFYHPKLFINNFMSLSVLFGSGWEALSDVAIFCWILLSHWVHFISKLFWNYYVFLHDHMTRICLELDRCLMYIVSLEWCSVNMDYISFSLI